jgi:hypothetical protein
MKASSIYGGFISAESISEPVTVTIAGLQVQSFTREGQEQRKLILDFEDYPGRLALNKTNAETIMGIYGDDTDNWLGQEITLAVESVDFKGKKVPGVRVAGVSF